MRRIVVCGLAATGLLTQAGAQPFGWFPGSTIIGDAETGDRVVIVNLADGTIESDVPSNPTAPAWQFTEDFAGKDPFIPSFSPNGEFVYLINGGKGDAPVSEPDGHIRLYSAVEVIQAFRSGSTPAPDSHIQEITIPAGGSDAVEPLCFTIDAAEPETGSRGYFIDSSYKKLYTYDINADSTLTQVGTAVDTGSSPSPIWLHPTAPFGFFCSFSGEASPQVNIVDTGDGPTAGTILRSIALALPAANDLFGVPYASCSLPIDVDLVQSNTVVPPSALPINNFPSNELWIFSGWTGFQVAPLFGKSIAPPRILPSGPVRMDDPFNVYKLDIQPGDAAVMDLTNGGSPEYTIDPNDRIVVFPPFIQLNENGNGQYALIGGSTIIKPDGTVDTLLQGSNDNWFPTVGEMVADRNEIYIGSASEASLDFDFDNPEYVPQHTNSVIFRYAFAPINKADVTLAKVATIDRSASLVVGRTDTKVVIGASDTLMLDLTDGVGNSAPTRNSLAVLLDPADATPEDSLVTIDLGLVAGAYGQQPFIEIPAGSNVAPTDIQLSASSASEAAAQGTVVGALTTTDADSGDTHTYSVVGEADAKAVFAFGIDGNNLVVNDASLLDVSVATTKNVTIRSTDQGALFFEKAFPITITPNVLVGGGGEAVRFLGDSNGDAFVNASDFTLTRNNIFDDYGCHDYRGVGDANGDGFVNASDFTITRNNIFNDYTDLQYEQALETTPCE